MSNRKSIFITGAASGIGLETARLFARHGWYVGLADINEGGARMLAAELGENNAFACRLDVTDADAFRDALAAFVRHTDGQLDVLFNNAGILRMGRNETIPLDAQLRIVDVNLNGVLTGIHHALPFLKNTPGARIVTMCSASSLYGVPEIAVYSATKHAVRALTEALDLELARHDIGVSDIIAPYVNTPMIAAVEQPARSVATTGIHVQPAQVARVVWKAAHGKGLHWRVHPLTHVLAVLLWAFPFLRRTLTRRLCLTR